MARHEGLAGFGVSGDLNQDISECINKIMNSLSFRKLAGKTQVILSLNGPDVRTRLTHTVEVAKIARDVCEKLKLNSMLAEAIALAHDIGHTPFGHVGERTLREIMCGCDTLDNKISEDYDLSNSGFKHNLQSYRVLKDLEYLSLNSTSAWNYILWGAAVHTKMTYAKPDSGMDNEILISSKHCEWVYSCFYHEKKQCKRNIQSKKKEPENRREICKPWYCAKLPIIIDRKSIKEELKPNETKEDYIKKKYIRGKYRHYIFCSNKCYLAKLWEHKINNYKEVSRFKYLYDHPFPNIFYAKPIYDHFIRKGVGDWISLESHIVNQADEIAQRQEDLEDSINKGLLSFMDARKQVEDLVRPFNENNIIKTISNKCKRATKVDELGKYLANFYKEILIRATQNNITRFMNKDAPVNVNIYSLANLLYSMDENTYQNRTRKWILKELRLRNPIESIPQDSAVRRYFNVSTELGYFYVFIYDYLVECTKYNIYDKEMVQILEKYYPIIIDGRDSENIKRILDDVMTETKDRKIHKPYGIIYALDKVRPYLKRKYKKEFSDYYESKKIKWINISDLTLKHFYLIYKLHERRKDRILSTKDILKIKGKYVHRFGPAYNSWRDTLNQNSTRVLANMSKFLDEGEKDEDIAKYKSKEKAIKNFEKEQKNIILKSEIVEKNDGKSHFILKRLFKAYITNSHQLPDRGLVNIIIALKDARIWKSLIESEERTFSENLQKLRKTMVDNDITNEKIRNIEKKVNFKTMHGNRNKIIDKCMKGTSNEIEALLESKKKLYDFFSEIDSFKDWKMVINREDTNSLKKQKKILVTLRNILDNPILNASDFWKSILIRGICDFIAGMTDQEAINEYEKLYAGIMELT